MDARYGPDEPAEHEARAAEHEAAAVVAHYARVHIPRVRKRPV
jgi:hypothetical protein